MDGNEWEQVSKDWTDRALALLERIRTLLMDAGYKVEKPVWFDISDDIRWGMMVNPPWGEGSADVYIEAHIEEDYEGDELDHHPGLQFAVHIIGDGGIIIGQLSPFNYTEDVWVPRNDPEALDARFGLLEAADYSNVPELLMEHDVMPTEASEC